MKISTSPLPDAFATLVTCSRTDQLDLPAGMDMDESLQQGVLQWLRNTGFKATPGQSALIPMPRGACLVVGVGETALGTSDVTRVIESLTRQLSQLAGQTLAIDLDLFKLAIHDQAWMAERLVLAIADEAYSYNEFKAAEDKPDPVRIHLTGCPDTAVHDALSIARGMDSTRTLGNMPPNRLYAETLADMAIEMAAETGLSIQVLDEAEIRTIGMNALLAVNAGSVRPPRVIVLKHEKGPSGQKPVVLVGKGVTFDSGGISIKPSASMDEMKYDMCGAAAVYGVMEAIARMDLPLNVIGIMGAVENMPAGGATRPGDIITSLSGKTIEILNTDAEGRLVLCDLLTWSQQFEPASVVDIATLTGACIVALGSVNSGVLGNHQPLVDELLGAARQTLDHAWQLPINPEYQQQLDSNFADMANIGGPKAGTITAAAFLSRFAESFEWAHLDIAGTAWRQGKHKGATGRPVPLLVEFLRARAAETA